MSFLADSFQSAQSLFRVRSLVDLVMGGPFLGVDIGTTSVKVAEIHTEKDGLALANYGILETWSYLERANSAIQTSSLTLMERETAAYLKTLVAHLGTKTTSAVASLPSFSAFTTLIELPTLSESEVEKVIKLQAKQYIPLPMEAVTVDWQKVGEKTDEQGVKKYQVLLIAVVSEQVKRYQAIFKEAGLHLRALEIEGLSLARILASGTKEPALIIDIGSRSTGFVIAANAAFKFGGQTDFSGGSLTQAIANGLNISTHRAEALKKLKGLGAGAGDQELSTLMEPILDVIISEAVRAKTNYETSYHEAVTSVILSGGGANLAGIERYVGDQIKLPTTVARPFGHIHYPPALEPTIRELGPLLAPAVGLGVRGAALNQI